MAKNFNQQNFNLEAEKKRKNLPFGKIVRTSGNKKKTGKNEFFDFKILWKLSKRKFFSKKIRKNDNFGQKTKLKISNSRDSN